jgi:hypothetical protein
VKPSDLSPEDRDRKFVVPVEHGPYRGVFWAEGFGKVATYYQRREVEAIWMGGIAGRCFIDDGALNPRAPDRSAFIKDDKWSVFNEFLLSKIRQIMLRVVGEGSNMDIDDHAATIENMLSPEDYQNALRFEFSVSDQMILRRAEKDPEWAAKRDASSLRWDVEWDVNHGVYDDEVLVDAPSADPESSSQPAAIQTKQVRMKQTKTTVREARQQKVPKSGVSLDDLRSERLVFWLGADELLDHKPMLAKAEYHGIKVVVARHRLHENALRSLPNVVHVAEVRDVVKHVAEVTNKIPQDPREERALRCLRLVEEKVYGEVEGRFHICDAVVTENHVLNDVLVEEKSSDPIAFTFAGRIYFQRKHLDCTDLVDLSAEEMTLGDRIFLARNVETLAHEVAHLDGLKDGTQEHAERTCSLMSEILNMVFPRK